MKKPRRSPPAEPSTGKAALAHGDQDESWRLRFSPRILSEDLPEIGHAAYEQAKKAILKKLPKAPLEYGAPLHAPLHGLYKLSVGHVRVAYHIEDAAHQVWVLMIGDRKAIWNSHQGSVLDRLAEQRQHVALPAPPPGPQRRRSR